MICTPASLKITNHHVGSCLFNPHKTEEVWKVTVSAPPSRKTHNSLQSGNKERRRKLINSAPLMSLSQHISVLPQSTGGGQARSGANTPPKCLRSALLTHTTRYRMQRWDPFSLRRIALPDTHHQKGFLASWLIHKELKKEGKGHQVTRS